jgi:predicted amidohydrolase
VEVPSESTAKTGLAEKYNTHMVIGINGRESKSLYNTLLFFDRKGRIMDKYRKLKSHGFGEIGLGRGRRGHP